MAVTLKDIAERTGVSPSVVSTVLSGRDNGTFVSETTRRKVLQVAEQLNYTPVRSGRPRGSRRLRRLRAEHFIGIWDPDYSPYTAHYIQSLQTALRQHIRQSGDQADDFGLRLLTPDDLPRLDVLGIMGMILLSPVLLPREAAMATIPSVMIGEVKNPPRELAQVHLDNFDAGQKLAEYLWGLGHRRIAFLAPTAHPQVTGRRYQGLTKVWVDHGLDAREVVPAPTDAAKSLSERDQVRQIVAGLYGPEAPGDGRPTALVCSDECVAALAAQALADLGCRVPGDVSLAAFGDTPRQAEAMIPALTTIREPVEKIAAAAIAQLYLMHDADTLDADEPRNFALPGELVVRASCAPPAGAEAAAA